MNINQKFHLRQDNHEITFFAYDIDFVDKITPYNLSKIYQLISRIPLASIGRG